ncbi:alpha/beta hydrolase [Nostoc sp. FACHB-152]|uniref:alpha/beta hydrolase n=1 Tax=unclassified Nostoc TaxID=2593658 RepID=UPI001686A0C7|nr:MULTISPECIES: alpha/beta hydrolase [unclassified Nostoc]MBD2449244.1 alpha/beta hydrolase [Nostoc sp. FACHB-152]MBD2470478.1 alpha/beta hydrolase [Nostoc sp. FACHB-145]
MNHQNFQLKVTFSLIASVTAVLFANHAIAAEKVIFKYQSFRPSISVDELTDLAETGKVSQNLNFYFNQARQNPETVRSILTKEVKAEPVILDRVLNSRVGELILDRIGKSVSTSSGKANQQALRSAIVLSANKDNKVSLMEIIQNYPTTEVVVDGERLAQTYQQLYILAENLQRILPSPTSSN